MYLSYTLSIVFFVGCYLFLQRKLNNIAFGFLILGHLVTLSILVMSKPLEYAYPFLNNQKTQASLSDPLPQALILTAIVISFALSLFLLSLFQRIFTEFKIESTDQLDPEAEEYE